MTPYQWGTTSFAPLLRRRVIPTNLVPPTLAAPDLAVSRIAPPDIAVVIPTFRRPNELDAALRSVIAQDGVTLEIVVVDDDPEGSAERVVFAVEDTRVIYVRMHHPSEGRPAMVRNAALPHVTAPLVHFLDDDDLIPSGHYARMKQAFDSHPEVGVVFGRVAPFGLDPAHVATEQAYFLCAAQRARKCRRFGRKWGFAATMLFENTLLVGGAAMIRRVCIAPLAGFDANLKVVEDIDFFSRAIRRFGGHFLDETVLCYRIAPSLIRRRNVQPIIDDCYRQMAARYRREWGRRNFYMLKIFARLFCSSEIPTLKRRRPPASNPLDDAISFGGTPQR